MNDQPMNPPPGVTQNPMQPVMEVLQGIDRDRVCAKYHITRRDLDQLMAQYLASVKTRAVADGLVMKKVGRNEPCPCGSGKKYKKCCMAKHEAARKALPPQRLQEMEKRAKEQEKLEKEVTRGFDLLMAGEYGKARKVAVRTLETYPEDDRFHDIYVSACLAVGEYDSAFYRSRERWQVALEERAFYQENGYHKRAGVGAEKLVHFYAPGTWLEKFWIAQRARHYAERYPRSGDKTAASLAHSLLEANNLKRFPQRDEEGIEARRKALRPVLDQLSELDADAALPHLLPLTYHFTWSSLFVPELIDGYGTTGCVRLLAELSMFRFPYFAQMCLSALEKRGREALPQILEVLRDNAAFDELKVGLLTVLGTIRTEESFRELVRFTEHDNPYLVNWAAQALGRHQNPEAIAHLERAKERLGELSKIKGAIDDLVRLKNRG